MKKYLLVLIITVLAISRFIYASKIPAGLSNDEIEYATSAKSYALSGKDVSGFGLPISLLKTKTDGDISPVPAILLSIPFKIFPMTQGSLRITYIFLNLLTAIPIFLIAEHLFPKRKIGFLAVILFLINPWSIYLSRVVVDTPFALFFYLCAITALFKTKGWKLVIPFALFLLAFFSYHGGKFIFVPVIFVCLIYKIFESRKQNKKKLAGYYYFALSTIIFVVAYFLISKSMSGSTLVDRSKELFFMNQGNISSIVDTKRRQSIDNPFKALFINKATETAKIFISKYLVSFSPDVLFVGGDIRATYRFGDHGLLYLFDILLLPIGLASIFSKDKSKFYLILGLILSAPIATGMNVIETSVINRSFLLLPIFVLISALGLREVFDFALNRTLRFVLTLGVTFVLTISFANFYSFYLFRFPIVAQENYWLSESILDKYIGYAKKDKSVEIITTRQRSSYLRYVLLNSELQQKYIYPNLPYITNNLTIPYKLENITFSGICPKTLDKNTVYAISTNTDCTVDQKPDFLITDQKDAGGLIRIYNSEICKEISTENWRRLNDISYYNLQTLSYEVFCKDWIFRP